MKFKKITTALSLFVATFTYASQLPTPLQETSNAELYTSSDFCDADCELKLAVFEKLCRDYEGFKRSAL